MGFGERLHFYIRASLVKMAEPRIGKFLRLAKQLDRAPRVTAFEFDLALDKFRVSLRIGAEPGTEFSYDRTGFRAQPRLGVYACDRDLNRVVLAELQSTLGGSLR